MNTRFRLSLILAGALLVVATYTFPVWSAILRERGEVFPFPELDVSLHEAFNAISPARQLNYLELRQSNFPLGFEMATSGLQPDNEVPFEEQILPEFSGQQAILTGEFVGLTANRDADGIATIYELPDGSHYLWLSEFRAIWGPDLRIFLSAQESAMIAELDDDEELALSPNDIFLGRITYNVGNQRFDIPIEADLVLFNSIIIYSQGLGLVYAIADLAEPE